MLTLVDGGGSPYSLNGFLDSCYIKNGSVTVGYVQGLTLNGAQLIVDHFAVDPPNRGGITADEMIRTFAKQVALDLPNVQTITFDLGRASKYCGIQPLANLRAALLTRIGANNIVQNQPNADCIVVSGDWPKANW